MEQAVNLFNKGLLMDTHPMVLGNDTLSDALNATFVTMNGNEVILQNDMGNRRIDNAFLPAGYEPVGMKEYGGVIYVAAYNPLTSRGLIGSFPSPLRKINTLNSASLLDFSNFLETAGEDVNIKVNNITVPISINEDGETITLHTGDKFSIYSDGITDLLPYICPSTFLQHLKNNLFTFLIGLFNSLNEFIDISDKLKLWDLINGNNHYEYYINDSLVTPSNNGEDDLIKARNCLDINTYSYKMASPLYLRAIINHVDNVSYSIIGDKKENGKCKIYIDVTYTYNCVDTINNEFFKIEFNGILCYPNETVINPIYLPEQEKYLLTLSYEVDDVLLGNSNNFNYTIKFPLLYDTNFNPNFGEDFNSPIYLKSLELSGTLDSTLFGSDAVILKGYRYYYDLNTNNTTLDISIESYPRKSSKYTVYPIIYKEDIVNGELVMTRKWELPELEGNPPGTGSYSIIFNHSQIKGNNPSNSSDTTEYYLEERELYRIKFFIKKRGLTFDEIQIPNTWDGIYITTPIFNGNYIGKELSTSLPNSGDYNYDEIKNAYIKNFYNIRTFVLTPQIECSYSQRKSKTDTETVGKIIYDKKSEENTGVYNLLDFYTVSTYITPSIKINNLELYPKEIDNLLSIKNITINNSTPNSSAVLRTLNGNNIYKDGSSYKYSTGLIDLSKYNDEHPLDVININEEYSRIEQTNELSFRTTVLINNYIKGDLIEKDNIPYNHKITSFWDYIRMRYYNSEETKFSGIVSPYACTDILGATPSIIIQKGKYEDLSWTDDSPGRLNFGVRNQTPQDQINAALLAESENLLVLDVNTENYSSMCYNPCLGEVLGYNFPFKRLWLKISEKEYTPIYITYHPSDSDEGKKQIFDDCIEGLISAKSFKYRCKHIPHYFAYTLDSGSFQAKIIDYNRTSKINEFDVTSEIILNLEAEIKRENTNNFKFEIEKNLITNISLLISFSEPNIVSNEKILDEYDNLRNFKINCILEHPVDLFLTNDDGTRVIEYKDSEGNDFDPLYVYYLKPTNSGFVKSYKPSKFRTEKGDDFPELKPSNELYHASDGRPHPYINSIIYPSYDERNAIMDWHTNNRILIYNNNIYPHYAAYASEYTSLYYQYPKYYDEEKNIRIFENHKKELHDKHTMQLCNINSSNFSEITFIYLDTKNIFDYKFILAYKLYDWEKTGDPMEDGWVDADTALQK